ncbi:unnamed protein product [Symbiodinium sp. CCMP2592]|nr:unnamed protein product [Symbiodinium sp. CCMP2592]CAE7363018.1 unnamed protein product [Symbiodinium sp. CCMP2592]
MALRQQKRQARQHLRPRPAQRSTGATTEGPIEQVAGTIRSAIAAGTRVPSHCLDFEPTRDGLEPEEVAFLRYLRWRTGPPPTTVFLKHLIRSLRGKRYHATPSSEPPTVLTASSADRTSTDSRQRLEPQPKKRPNVLLQVVDDDIPPGSTAAAAASSSPGPPVLLSDDEGTLEIHAGSIHLECVKKVKRKQARPGPCIDLETPLAESADPGTGAQATLMPLPIEAGTDATLATAPTTAASPSTASGPGALIQALLQPREADSPAPLSESVETVDSPEVPPELPLRAQPPEVDRAISSQGRAKRKPSGSGRVKDRHRGKIKTRSALPQAGAKTKKQSSRASSRVDGPEPGAFDSYLHDSAHIPDPDARPRRRSPWFVQSEGSTAAQPDSDPVRAGRSSAYHSVFYCSALGSSHLLHVPRLAVPPACLFCMDVRLLQQSCSGSSALPRAPFPPMASTGTCAPAEQTSAPATPITSRPDSPPPGVERRSRPQQNTLEGSSLATAPPSAGSLDGPNCNNAIRDPTPESELRLLFGPTREALPDPRPSMPSSMAATMSSNPEGRCLEMLQQTIERWAASLQRSERAHEEAKAALHALGVRFQRSRSPRYRRDSDA